MLRDVYNSGKKEVTFKGVEYTKGDIDLYLNKEDKVVNNIVISTAIIDADRGDEIKLGKSITGGSVTGAGVYNTGDKVSHNGTHWICTSDANVYEPGVYGWDQL